MAGRKPGTPRTGGRQKGTPNKATASIKEAARAYTEEALRTLAEIMQSKAAPEAARVSAANSLLDRAYGKPSQVVGGDADNPLKLVTRIELVGVSPDGDGPA